MPYYFRDPKADHNFDNHPYKPEIETLNRTGPERSGLGLGFPCQDLGLQCQVPEPKGRPRDHETQRNSDDRLPICIEVSENEGSRIGADGFKSLQSLLNSFSLNTCIRAT